ncbi:hypothetical protein BDW42DRAFT_163662 [Aspergillus taichungensis]|uniref:Uncharacterized protein n=1 Tax=Aspergillus taichungensis TaxID=482145 RepID=A0A2J5I2Q8_9EURO|nr:hypothetical protein BDW42DRAFT_163662 [Aspergillus taichungensis]
MRFLSCTMTKSLGLELGSGASRDYDTNFTNIRTEARFGQLGNNLDVQLDQQAPKLYTCILCFHQLISLVIDSTLSPKILPTVQESTRKTCGMRDQPRFLCSRERPFATRRCEVGMLWALCRLVLDFSHLSRSLRCDFASSNVARSYLLGGPEAPITTLVRHLLPMTHLR